VGKYEIRQIGDSDREWMARLLKEQWGSEKIVTRGKCEITSLDSLVEGIGIGTTLIESVKEVAKANKCRKVWLITTNDNLHALGFYQKRGFVIANIYANAIAESRKLKPEIPEIGNDGIVIRDEIEMEIKV
jgi:GNAT superfamily N-acetyltransferase